MRGKGRSPADESAKAPRKAPTYRKLADTVRSQIRGGKLATGDRLPTDAELVAQYGVSRYTARRAYSELVGEGLVNRASGRGTFTTATPAYHRTFSSVDELLNLASDTVMEVMEPLRRIRDWEAAAALALPFDEVLHVGYRRFHDGSPFCFTDVYLPPRLQAIVSAATYLLERGAQAAETVLGLLDRELPSRVVGARQAMTAVSAPERLAADIGCEPGDPVLVIERVHFDADGRPVERCVNHFNPARYVYRLPLERHATAATRVSSRAEMEAALPTR